MMIDCVIRNAKSESAIYSLLASDSRGSDRQARCGEMVRRRELCGTLQVSGRHGPNDR
jgi:hypothetical protein